MPCDSAYVTVYIRSQAVRIQAKLREVKATATIAAADSTNVNVVQASRDLSTGRTAV